MVTTDQIVKVVDELDSLGYIRKKKVTGDWYTIYCPFHKDGKERKPSCGVSIKPKVSNGKKTEAGHFYCFTCHHSKPLVPSVQEILNINNVPESASEWLKSHVPGIELDNQGTDTDDLIPGPVMGSLVSKFAVDYVMNVSSKGKSSYVPEEELESYRYTVPYMYERGLTDEIIERYDIGFDPNHVPENKNKPVPCVTFPVKDRQGRCLFIFRRSIEGRYFNYPTGVEKPLYGLYELSPKAKTVYICESAFNLMTLVRHGLEGVALFGTGNSFQMQQLRELGAKRFVLATDPDEAGQRARKKLRKNLSKVAFISELHGFPEGKDLNDLTDEEFENLYIE